MAGMQFSFEHVFRAPSPAVLFAAYFDPKHQVEQDSVLDIAQRELVELVDDGRDLRRICRVIPRRQLPSIARAVVGGPLQYLDTAVWHRDRDQIEVDVRVGTRVQISAIYKLDRVG